MFKTHIGGVSLHFAPALLALSLILIAAACSGGGDGTDPANGGDPGDPMFDVVMGDNFFEPKTFSVGPGQRVTFNLANDGALPHNMRVDGDDGAYGTDDDTLSDPPLIQAGDSATLVWTAPDEPGEITFRCDFHPVDMIGTISVE